MTYTLHVKRDITFKNMFTMFSKSVSYLLARTSWENFNYLFSNCVYCRKFVKHKIKFLIRSSTKSHIFILSIFKLHMCFTMQIYYKLCMQMKKYIFKNRTTDCETNNIIFTYAKQVVAM